LELVFVCHQILFPFLSRQTQHLQLYVIFFLFIKSIHIMYFNFIIHVKTSSTK
jgi:hypothetical protein